jgi:predicted dehydrogenase
MKPTVFSASVVGGGAGGRLSLHALKNSGRFRLAAAADLRPDVRAALEKEFPGVETFASHEEMFARCPTEVVCVSTYAPSHEPVTEAALKMSGLKGILVEKPLGDTAASGRRILEAIRAHGLPMAVPHGLRAKATPLEIVERVRRGDIGELKLIEVQCDKWDLINSGIHWLDFCLAATGGEPVVSVLAAMDTSTRTYRDGMQVETAAVTYVEEKKGVRLVLQTGDFIKVNTPGKDLLFRLVGTCGLIEFWGWEAPYFIVHPQCPGGEKVVPVEFSVTGHQRHLETMARQIDAGVPDYRGAESSLLALEICEGAFLSHRHGCLVRFPLADFVPPPRGDWDPGKPYAGQGGGRDGRKLA